MSISGSISAQHSIRSSTLIMQVVWLKTEDSGWMLELDSSTAVATSRTLCRVGGEDDDRGKIAPLKVFLMYNVGSFCKQM